MSGSTIIIGILVAFFAVGIYRYTKAKSARSGLWTLYAVMG
jgi:hypothetical protein